MKTEFQKMRSGELYDYSDPEIEASFAHARPLCARLQTLTTDDPLYRPTMEELIPGFPESACFVPPFHCDHGSGIIVGRNVFVNFNAVMIDGGYIRLGNDVKIGPNCSLCTPNHPTDYLERRGTCETSRPISIGDDTWLGSNVTVCPGVTIGRRCIIAAGSVVTHDIPDDSLAAGVPAVVKKSLKKR